MFKIKVELMSSPERLMNEVKGFGYMVILLCNRSEEEPTDPKDTCWNPCVK
jgi:hypothetical protein